MEIKRVELYDVEKLERISKLTFKETFGDENTKQDMDEYFEQNMNYNIFKDDLLKDGIEYYILYNGSNEVGYIKLNIKDDVCKLVRIYVLSEHHSNGYGQALLDYAKKVAKVNKLNTIELGVWEHNLKAIKFYEKNKFKIIGTEEFLLGTDVQTDYTMQLKIGE